MTYFLLSGGVAAWMYWDGNRRQYPIIPWAIAAVVVPFIVLPVYLAKRPLKDGEVREGGVAWNILKYFCVAWTATMLFFAVVGFVNAAISSDAQSDAEKAGEAIGVGIGMGLICAGWFFPTVGAAALGLMLRKSSIVERGPTVRP